MKTVGLALLFSILLSSAGYYALETNLLDFGGRSDLPSAAITSGNSETTKVADAETSSSGTGTSNVQIQTASEENNSRRSSASVISKGFVKPVRESKLSMATDGIIREVLVSEGDSIAEGQILMRLDNTQQHNRVNQAKASLQIAQAKLAEIRSGARTQEVAAAQASVDAARAQLARLSEQTRPEEDAAAVAALQAAEARLAQLRKGPDSALLVAAQADVQAAEARLAQLYKGPEAAVLAAAQSEVQAAEARLAQLYSGPDATVLTTAQAELDNASVVLRDAKRAYEQVKWRNDIGMLPESQAMEQATNAYIAARSNYDTAAQGPKADAIATAQSDIESAKARLTTLQTPALNSDVQNAQSEIESAKARLATLQKPALDSDIQSAQAEIESAKARLATLRKPALDSDVQNAQAELRRAEAQLELVQSGVRSETILVAEAEVRLAEVTLEQANSELLNTELKAPFTGTVAQLNISVGEFVSSGVPLIELGDFAGWQIETDNLLELDVVKFQKDAPALVRINAIPGLELTGRVKQIRRIGEDKVGDITYTVIVALDEYAEELEWNMTATVTIEPF